MRPFTPILGSLRRTGPSVMALLVLHGAAFAQEAAPQPNLGRTPSLLWGFLLMAALLVAVIMVSIMPSKRSHQD